MDDACKTRYPLILVPGLLGFISLLGHHYWYGLLALLHGQGAQAFAVLVSPVHATEVRGEQLRERIETILRETGASRVNLIGHSQGALTARYVAACYPHYVASVTSIAGPNHGSEVADAQLRRAPLGSWRERLYGAWLRVLCWLWALLETGYRGPRLPVDTRAAQASLTTAGVTDFNRRYPQGLPQEWGGQGASEVNGIRYYSWSGTLQPDTHRGGNRFDLSHAYCRWSTRHFVREREQNDGLVGRFSSHLGQVIRSDYPLDHFDVVNQHAGLLGPGAEPLQLFREHAQRLREAGL